jgi:hypothetical protein
LTKLANIFGVNVYELFKPDEDPVSETKEAVRGLVNDISVTFQRSLGEISKKYLV